jgi:hypothetical protein
LLLSHVSPSHFSFLSPLSLHEASREERPHVLVGRGRPAPTAALRLARRWGWLAAAPARSCLAAARNRKRKMKKMQ